MPATAILSFHKGIHYILHIIFAVIAWPGRVLLYRFTDRIHGICVLANQGCCCTHSSEAYHLQRYWRSTKVINTTFFIFGLSFLFAGTAVVDWRDTLKRVLPSHDVPQADAHSIFHLHLDLYYHCALRSLPTLSGEIVAKMHRPALAPRCTNVVVPDDDSARGRSITESAIAKHCAGGTVTDGWLRNIGAVVKKTPVVAFGGAIRSRRRNKQTGSTKVDSFFPYMRRDSGENISSPAFPDLSRLSLNSAQKQPENKGADAVRAQTLRVPVYKQTTLHGFAKVYRYHPVVEVQAPPKSADPFELDADPDFGNPLRGDNRKRIRVNSPVVSQCSEWSTGVAPGSNKKRRRLNAPARQQRMMARSNKRRRLLQNGQDDDTRLMDDADVEIGSFDDDSDTVAGTLASLMCDTTTNRRPLPRLTPFKRLQQSSGPGDDATGGGQQYVPSPSPAPATNTDDERMAEGVSRETRYQQKTNERRRPLSSEDQLHPDGGEDETVVQGKAALLSRFLEASALFDDAPSENGSDNEDEEHRLLGRFCERLTFA